jgi:hypothetical protein
MRWEEQLHKVFDKIRYTKGSISIKGVFDLKITGIKGDTVTYTVELHFVPKDMKLYTDFPGDYGEQLDAWNEYADEFMESKELTDRLQNQIMQRVNKVYGQRRNGFSISPVDNYYQIESGGSDRGPLLLSKQYKGYLKIETKDTSWTKVSLYEDNKMSLRNKLIRLAHEKPELREHLLPLVKQALGKAKKHSLVGSQEIWWLKLGEMLHFGGIESLIADVSPQSITFSNFGVNGVPARIYAERGFIYADIEGVSAMGIKPIKKAKLGTTSQSSHEDIIKALRKML